MSEVEVSKLVVGDLIYASIHIDRADMANPKATSGTAKKIKKGEPVVRHCVVLEKNEHSVVVTYLATFGGSKKLPTTLQEVYWYPIEPAEKEGKHEPLPELNPGVAQWASLRKKQTVTGDVKMSDMRVRMSEESVHLVLSAMHA
ncbi:uncharacterized protein FIBRA_01554 [Fibroporia radiculosa]|uniref:Uncharacterized protein n=1 Tax=Fibroporia radiculosa TaxID=599839 RepID=J4I8J8_9APHY|nr:uncharacterized protein FIBRA_01554 [Fibroporia radiculosa]CCL99536.1 predicted protein [Fibroporia radiculosa]